MPHQRAPESPESYYSVAARLARDIPGAFKPDQYWNQENPAAHETTTGPEIWEQTEGRITHFVASVGTGGTITGAARALKARNPAIQVIGADPEGSVLSGDTARPYLTEGVGEDFMPGHLRPDRGRSLGPGQRPRRLRDGPPADPRGGDPVRRLVRDRDGRRARGGPRARRDARRAIDAVVVVLLPDSGRSYLSKIYNDEWMRANGLLADDRGGRRASRELLADRHHAPDMPAVVVARTTERVGDAIATLQAYGISQLPVSEDARGRRGRRARRLDQRAAACSSARSATRSIVERTVGEVMDPPLPLVEASATLDEAFALLSGGASALSRSAATARPASSPSSTSSSTWPTSPVPHG